MGTTPDDIALFLPDNVAKDAAGFQCHCDNVEFFVIIEPERGALIGISCTECGCFHRPPNSVGVMN